MLTKEQKQEIRKHKARVHEELSAIESIVAKATGSSPEITVDCFEQHDFLGSAGVKNYVVNVSLTTEY